MIENINEIKSQINIVDIIQSYLPLKKTVANYIAKCPFHDENTPSLSVSKSKNIFHCFGCGEGGNGIDFIMKYCNLSFELAIKEACKICNIEIQESKRGNKSKDTQERLERFYLKSLDLLYRHEKLCNYLVKRGIKKEMFAEFGLGFAPDYKDIIDILGRELAFNLGFLTEKGYNFFNGRLLFCIKDENNKIVGFSGRAYDLDKTDRKYINSKESFLYKKNNVLYNYVNALNILKRTKAKHIYIVEGYFDALTCNLLEIPAVAVCSANIHINQIKTLSKMLREDTLIHIALDSDEAGRNGSIRAYKQMFLHGFIETNISRLQKPYKDLNEFYIKGDVTNIPFKHYCGLEYCMQVEIGLAKSIKEKNQIINSYEKMAEKTNDIFTRNFITKRLNKYLVKKIPQLQDNVMNKSEEYYILTELAQDKQKRFIAQDVLNSNDFSDEIAFNDIMQSKDTSKSRYYILQEINNKDVDTFYKIILRFKIYKLELQRSIAINRHDMRFIVAINDKLKELRNRLLIPF